jgi:putative transposase
VTKYRFKIIDKEIENALKWIIKEICDWKEIDIMEGAVKEEHIHMYLQIPPKHSISDVMK